MFKKTLTYHLLFIHLAFLLLPEAPFWLYLARYGRVQESFTESNVIKGDRPLTGDITFLRALIERAHEKDDQAEKPILPERNAPSFVLYFSDLSSFCSKILFCDKLTFTPYTSKTISRFLIIPSPPPKFF